MRALTELTSFKDAKDFSDFLSANGIENRIELVPPERWVVWVIEEDDLAQARTLLEKFKANPHAQEIQSTIKLYRDGQALTTKLSHQRAKIKSITRHYPGPVHVRVTIGLIIVSVVVSILTGFGQHDPFGILSWLSFSNVPKEAPEIFSGQIWRLITPIFLHFSPLHLIFNVIWIYDLGRGLETTLGKLRFIALVSIIAIFSNFLEYTLGHYLFGGMSGVIYGLAAFIYVSQKLDPFFTLYLSPTAVAILGAWLIVCWTPLISGVANYAHIGGLGAGALLALLRYYYNSRRKQSCE